MIRWNGPAQESAVLYSRTQPGCGAADHGAGVNAFRSGNTPDQCNIAASRIPSWFQLQLYTHRRRFCLSYISPQVRSYYVSFLSNDTHLQATSTLPANDEQFLLPAALQVIVLTHFLLCFTFIRITRLIENKALASLNKGLHDLTQNLIQMFWLNMLELRRCSYEGNNSTRGTSFSSRDQEEIIVQIS
jgi:hypothetical protein